MYKLINGNLCVYANYLSLLSNAKKWLYRQLSTRLLQIFFFPLNYKIVEFPPPNSININQFWIICVL